MTQTIAHPHIALADTGLPIWRREEVPVDAKGKMLGNLIQSPRSGLDYHLWEFKADDKNRAFQLPTSHPHRPDDALSSVKKPG